MNDYQKLIELIKANKLEIHAEKVYDGLSGWVGQKLWIVDKSNYFNKIFDLSVNGFGLREENIPRAIQAVERYLESKNMESFDDFLKWLDKNKKVI